jgi:hypothetical protein
MLACALFAGSTMLPVGAEASIHEIVAAFCSGGGKGAIDESGFLEAPGVSDPTKKNFARPVVATQSAIILSTSPLRILITGSKAAKYPEGTVVVDIAAMEFLLVSLSDSQATHCVNFSDLP